jgi:hypothetical protein
MCRFLAEHSSQEVDNGFQLEETLLRWPPRSGAFQPSGDAARCSSRDPGHVRRVHDVIDE